MSKPTQTKANWIVRLRCWWSGHKFEPIISPKEFGKEIAEAKNGFNVFALILSVPFLPHVCARCGLERENEYATVIYNEAKKTP